MRISAFALARTMLLLALVLLGPQRAFAVSLAEPQCEAKSMMSASIALAAIPERSMLETIRIQQERRFIPARTVPITFDDAAPYLDMPCERSRATSAIIPTPATINDVPVNLDRPDVFGSIALPVSHTPLDTKWLAASGARLAKSSGPWVSLIRNVAGKERAEQLQAVNNWVNARVQFTNDGARSGDTDRWSGASETLRRNRGDCEDYAIAKMKLLEAAGVARSDMYLVIVDDLVRRADHALLVVRLGTRMVILDNSTDVLLDAQSAHDYRPIFSFGDKGAWVHGYLEQPVIAFAST